MDTPASTSSHSLQPPPLPPALVNPRPVVVAGLVLWLIATALAYAVPELSSWRPVTIAGLVTGMIGTSIFLVQLRASRRGSQGAQTGL